MDAAWFDDGRTPRHEDRAAIVDQALARAWEDGVKRWGEAVAEWPYADSHRLKLRHPLGALPLIGRLLDRGPFPLAGSATTVADFPSRWPGLGRPISEGSTMRWVAVAGNGDRSLAVLPGGQSGHPFDAHYDDQLDAFLHGRTHPLAWSEKAIGRATVSVLHLRP